MKIHLLLTNSINIKRPETVKIFADWGQLRIVIDKNIRYTRRGLHCFVEGTQEDLIHWFSQCDEIIMGSGSPQLENFVLIETKDMTGEEIKEIIVPKKLKY